MTIRIPEIKGCLYPDDGGRTCFSSETTLIHIFPLPQKKAVQKISSSILKTLAYFDMFSYPLLAEEIDAFMDQSADEKLFRETLADLTNKKQVYRMGDYYSIRNDPALVAKRKIGNRRALPLLKKAEKVGRLLYKFPFVRAIGISGSLSKNFADENADFDFFIITATNRLWIARTCMHLLKKLSFLIRRQHWLCLNYYISEDSLAIAEKNVFTATEILTLVPVCGEKTFADFFEANNWTKSYYPNLIARPIVYRKDRQPIFKKIAETLLNNSIGDWLDEQWMKITTRRWDLKKHRQQLNMKGELLDLRTSKNVARPEPGNFQKKVLDLYKIKTEEIGRLSFVNQDCFFVTDCTDLHR